MTCTGVQEFLVLLMMGAVTPETCRVILQENKSDCILLHPVGFLLILNYDARNRELKKIGVTFTLCQGRKGCYYIYLLQLGCYPVAGVILHVNKT